MNARIVSFWEKTVETGILLIAFLLPLAFYLQSYDSALIKEATLQAGVLAVLAAALLRCIEAGRFELPASRAWPAAAAGALLLWVVLSYAFCAHPGASAFGALRTASFLILFLIVLSGPSSLAFGSTLCGWVLAAASAAALYAVFQAAGADPLLWSGAFGKRAFSTLEDPDLLGVFLGAMFPLGLMRSADAERSMPSRTASMAASVLLAAGVLASGSPAGLLALCVSAGSFALLVLTRCQEPPVRGSGLVGAAAVALTAGSAVFLRGGVFRGELLSRAPLLREVWSGAVRLLRDNLIAGAGAGSFAAAYPAYGSPRVFELAGRHDLVVQGAYSAPLQTAAELGLVGLVLWAGLFIIVLAAAWLDIGRRSREGEVRGPSVMVGLWAATAGLLAGGLVSDALRHAAPGALLWILAGCLAGLALERGSAVVHVLPVPAPLKARRLLYAPLLACAVLGLWLPVSALMADLDLNRGVRSSRQGGWEAALTRFDAVPDWHPSGAMARYASGELLEERGDLKAALARYLETSRLRPHYAQVDLRKAVVRMELGDWRRAQAGLLASIRLDPFEPRAYSRLAEVSEILKDRETARFAALRLIGLEPEEAAYWRLLAEQYRSSRRYRTAKRMMDKASRVHDLALSRPRADSASRGPGGEWGPPGPRADSVLK